MDINQAKAVIVRSGVPDTAYYFGAPVRTLAGGAGDWYQLSEILAVRSHRGSDMLHPPGGLVGAFRYDGSFVFHDCPEMRVGSCDGLWPDVIARVPGPDDAWHSPVDCAAYGRMVERAQEYIRAGDIYQVNLARRFSLQDPGVDARSLFQHLWAVTEAPLSAFVEILDGAICSASPELFLSIEGRQVTTRPIKGTRPRDQDPLRDRLNAYELSASPKEQAELVMITDLERNDLGRVCEYGSVVVDELVKRETYSHVHHLVSTVTGTLREGVGPVEALQACFPGGSITGAPKKRAMEIISELEPGDRGWYTGAVGYFGYDGSAQFNIAIRTVVVGEGVVHFHAGSGITADSDALHEYDETMHKASAMRQAFSQYRCAAPVPNRGARML